MDSKSHSYLEQKWIQVTAHRGISDSNFREGVLDFNFNVGGAGMVFIPSKSYFRVGCTLNNHAGAQPTIHDQIALADNFSAGLFQSCSFQAGGVDVSTVASFLPQAQALKTRTSKNYGWLKSIGRDVQFCDADFQSRVNRSAAGFDTRALTDEITQRVKLASGAHVTDYKVQIANTTGDVTGTNTDFAAAGVVIGDQLLINGVIYTVVAGAAVTDTAMRVTPLPAAAVDTGTTGTAVKLMREFNGDGRRTVYSCFQPALGIFDHPHHIGSGSYRIQCNPNSNYKTACVEAKNGQVHNFRVETLEFYACVAKYPESLSGTDQLDLNEIAVYQTDITSLTGEQVTNMTVPSSTYAISLFIQDGSAGTDSKIPPSSFTNLDRSDLKVTAFQISYANTMKPVTQYTSTFTDTTNQLQQRYYESVLENDLDEPEPFRDWIKRGAIYTVHFGKDRNDRSTNLQVSTTFAGVTAGSKIFIAAHYVKMVDIVSDKGYIINVTSATR